MEATKWTAAAASIWIQCSCGMSYAFGIYFPILKSSQGYDQSTLDTLSVFKDIGANAGILSGILYSATSRRGAPRFMRGPWVVHAAGAVQCFVGYFFLWLAVTGAIPRPNVAVMCLFMFLAAHAQTFFNTANVVTAVENFPSYSGTVVGIMKIGFADVLQPNGVEPMVVDAKKLIQGSLYKGVLRSGSQSYLANLSLYPGRIELPFLPSNTQAVILQPLGDKGIAIVGGNTIKGFATADQAWITLIGQKLDATLAKAVNRTPLTVQEELNNQL